MSKMMVGGTSLAKEATPEVQTICDEVKPQVEEKSGQKFDTFTCKSFTTQVVAGTNYFLKVHVGGEEFLHLRVHKALPHSGGQVQLQGLQTSKAHQDPLDFF